MTADEQSTMRMIIFLLIASAASHFANAVEVSSQIDWDYREDVDTASATPAKASVNVHQDNERTDPNTRGQKPSAFRADSVGIISNSGDAKRRRSYVVRGESTKPPAVINNIQIVVNGNETDRSLGSCKNGVCDISVTSKPDQAGNIVTNVHLTIVTKLNKAQVGDIPVIDGFRGVESIPDRSPDFSLLNHPNSRPHLYNNVPQIQMSHQDPNEIWYQTRRTFQRPSTVWYSNTPTHSHPTFRNTGWSPIKPVIDDKIEPPLSKTNRGNE